jgi:hypothetical protein
MNSSGCAWLIPAMLLQKELRELRMGAIRMLEEEASPSSLSPPPFCFLSSPQGVSQGTFIFHSRALM